MDPKQKQKSRLANFACLAVAGIWGSGFIASEYALEAQASPALIMALRFSVAAALLALLAGRRIKQMPRHRVKQSIAAGLLLFAAFYLQILGQRHTTVSNSAFLTATNVVMVPFLVWGATGKRPNAKTFMLTGAALAGTGLLTISPGNAAFNIGDGMVLLCALFFALHICCLGQIRQGGDPLCVTAVQLLTAAAASLLVLALFDRGALCAVQPARALVPVLYLGVMSTGLCYLLQTWAQKYTSPAKAGIILSAEGLFGSLFSVALRMEAFTPRLAAGGMMILTVVILMELPPRKKGREGDAA
ncbi:DMT family transporter [Allofournierella sp.]|uniref:DMT family transporter n=1 Tax=Allofournierella sp. TaxID=1940256 RepID=UPI003AB659D9